MKIKQQISPEGFVQMHIYIVRGMDEQFTVSQRDAEGNFVPFEAGDQIVWTVAHKAGGKPIFEKIVTEFTDGKAIMRADRADTVELDFGVYVHDVEKINSDNNHKPLIYYSHFHVCNKV